MATEVVGERFEPARDVGVCGVRGELPFSGERHSAAATVVWVEHLRVRGFDNVFAIGDMAATGDVDSAQAASAHGELVATNIRALGASQALTAHEPKSPSIVLPLGPKGGASYIEGMGMLDAARTAELKGQDLLVERFAQLFR